MSAGHIDGTREEILAILRRRERVGVEDLARELGLAGATVRRHLDVLQRDNYVAVTQVRGQTGRPRHLFSLTEAGADLFPHHYVRLTQRLLGEIVGLDARETAGRSGGEIASLVFEKMADRLAAEYAPHVTGATLEARVRSAVNLVADEGLDFEVAPREGGVHLLGRGCPCTRLTGSAAGTCDHDRRMLEQILGVRVQALPPADIPHDFHCGYLVTEHVAAP
ncbi:MAG: winged helix-turn-helix transcriptional regulator [Dehalococcoidia bacterium]